MSVPPSLPSPLASPPPLSRILRLLREASEEGLSGELVARYGDRSGRIHLTRGAIAWVQSTPDPVSLANILRDSTISLDQETAAAVLRESKQSRKHFAEILLNWGIAQEEELKEALRRFLSKQLEQLLSFSEASALFLPSQAHQPARFAFSLGELERDPLASSGIRPSHPALLDAKQKELLCELEKRTGILGITVLGRTRGDTLHASGQPIERGLQRTLLGALNRLQETGAHVLLGAQKQAFAAFSAGETRAILVAFDPEILTQGRILALLREFA